jgi:hemerythrin-like domain-containing protein
VTESLVELLLACHDRIRSFIGLARTLARDESSEPAQVVESCRRCERYFAEALPLHVADEEASILPRLAGKSPEVDAALATMASEHAEHARALEALLAALRELGKTPSSRAARSRLGAAADPLGLAFDAHLALEERVLFPAISTLLEPTTRDEIVRELRLRRETKGAPAA